MSSDFFVHSTAEVSDGASIGSGTKVWHLSQIREGVSVGENCVIGKNVYIDFGVEVGDNCKIQNNTSVYHGSRIEDGVFLGPHVCITNDKSPRAINVDGSLKSGDDWEVGETLVKRGASVGAGSLILPGVTVGEFAMVGAGSVVTKDVPDFALVFGNPANMKGWVCACGLRVREMGDCKKCNSK